jgi:hypothetical protein
LLYFRKSRMRMLVLVVVGLYTAVCVCYSYSYLLFLMNSSVLFVFLQAVRGMPAHNAIAISQQMTVTALQEAALSLEAKLLLSEHTSTQDADGGARHYYWYDDIVVALGVGVDVDNNTNDNDNDVPNMEKFQRQIMESMQRHVHSSEEEKKKMPYHPDQVLDDDESSEHNIIIAQDEVTWTNAGYVMEAANIDAEHALQTVQRLPLKTYELVQADSKQRSRDLHVSRQERRTRIHTGVILPDNENENENDGGTGTGIIPPRMGITKRRDTDWFALNLKALAALEEGVDHLDARLLSLKTSLMMVSISTNSTTTSDGDIMRDVHDGEETSVASEAERVIRPSVAQLQAEALVLESNVTLTERLQLSAHHIRVASKQNQLHQRTARRLQVETIRGESSTRLSLKEHTLTHARQQWEVDLNTQLDVISQYGSLVRQIISSKVEAKR